MGGPAFTGKVGSVSWSGPDSKSMSLPKIDMGKTQRKFQHFFRGTGVPIPNAAYTIKTKDGRVFQGQTDQEGYTGTVELDEMEILSVAFDNEEDGHDA